jgi:transcriptional regulator with XRE-family HTH domain
MHLAKYMSDKKLSDGQVAMAIKKSRPTVNRIRRGVQRPDWNTIEAIRKFTRGAVTADDFANGP